MTTLGSAELHGLTEHGCLQAELGGEQLEDSGDGPGPRRSAVHGEEVEDQVPVPGLPRVQHGADVERLGPAGVLDGESVT